MPGHTARHRRRLDYEFQGLQRPIAWDLSGKEVDPYWTGWHGLSEEAYALAGAKQLETAISPFSAPIPRKPDRNIHYAKPELIAGFEMTSWTNDGVIRQASLQEVREKPDKAFRPDWINLPERSDY
jgi:hypothetical protein